MKLPRIMIAAPSSGSGKTLLTCGLLKLFVEQGFHPVSFKGGPDYIDPMFHRTVLEVPARNLDTFFTENDIVKYLLAQGSKQADITILEGVMGFYDGAGGITTSASSYELSKITDTPVILVVNAKGMSLSVIPLIQGFLEYKADNRIVGVILNQISPVIYRKLKEKIEKTLPIKVFGYIPYCPELVISSRHLGLVMPSEIQEWKEKLLYFSCILEETLEIEEILICARSAKELQVVKPKILEQFEITLEDKAKAVKRETIYFENKNKLERNIKVRIGIAKDNAFCFYYEENLEILRKMGAELVFFSPLYDSTLPSNLDGLIFYGGYPELYAKKLSENCTMRREIYTVLKQGIPYLAECGGFLYLQEFMEDMDGKEYPMVGIFSGKAYQTKKLGRFGYITLTTQKENQLLEKGTCIKAHEFHYFDCTDNGKDYHGVKPSGEKEWDCIRGGTHYAAGFPHLYYYSNLQFVQRFINQCKEYRRFENKIEKEKS